MSGNQPRAFARSKSEGLSPSILLRMWSRRRKPRQNGLSKGDRHRTSAPQSLRSSCGASPLLTVQGDHVTVLASLPFRLQAAAGTSTIDSYEPAYQKTPALDTMTTPAEPPLDPTALARFGRLELLARLVVEGVMSGLHKSPFKGFSVEFAEHRQYGPGDEIRHIDWRAFGKSDRYYVKEYEEETNLRAYIVVDSSGSMGYSGQTVSKFEHARRLAASLAYLMISQRDAVGLVTFDDSVRGMIPPRAAPGHFSVLCKALEDTKIGGEAPLSGILHTLAERIWRRGLVVIVSDGFDQLDELTSALRHLRHRRHEVLFLHVLAPEEEEFPFRRPSRFRDLEHTSNLLRVDPVALRATYLERFRAFCDGLKDQCRAMDIDYHKASTAESVETTLLNYLAARAGRA